jgi:ABC-type antimicrobial peptide transport system permease subunit
MVEPTRNEIGVTDFAVREHRSLWRDAWRRLISNRTARIGMAVVAIFVITTVLAHFFWEYDPRIDLDYSLKLKPPNLFPNEEVESIHPFGTDKLGRDIFRRVVHGGWNSLRVGLVAVGISISIGGLFGLFAGFYESIGLSRAEKIFLRGVVGILLGALPAWIAGQFVQVILFGILSIAAAVFDNFLAGKRSRIVFFAGAGLYFSPALLCGGWTSSWPSPVTYWRSQS